MKENVYKYPADLCILAWILEWYSVLWQPQISVSISHSTRGEMALTDFRRILFEQGTDWIGDPEIKYSGQPDNLTINFSAYATKKAHFNFSSHVEALAWSIYHAKDLRLDFLSTSRSATGHPSFVGHFVQKALEERMVYMDKEYKIKSRNGENSIDLKLFDHPVTIKFGDRGFAFKSQE